MCAGGGSRSRLAFTILSIYVIAMAMIAVPVGPAIQQTDSGFLGIDEADGATGYWTYTITSSGTVTGSGVDRNGNSIAENPTRIGPTATDSSFSNSYTSTSTENVGSWGFDAEGYGPFGSFYAAFDPNYGNKMVCILNPYDLTKDVSGGSVDSGMNIMWCLPTIYWKVSGTDLILTNNKDSGGVAYAHTVYDNNGEPHTYKYIAIGVYEAATATVNGSTTILTSQSGAGAPASEATTKVLVNQNRGTMRGYANNQTVNPDGSSGGAAMLWNFYQYELYKYCALATMGSWDSQSVAGNGYVYKGVSGSSGWGMGTGTMDASGPYAGTIGSTDAHYQNGVKLFIENPWGSLFTFVDGIVFQGYAYVIDQKAVPNDATSAGTGVTVLTDRLPSSGWGSNPSSNAQIWGMPTGNSGSASGDLYDYVSSNVESCGLSVGGLSNNDQSYALQYGLSYTFAYNDLSFSFGNIGGRLAFVFDADPASSFSVQYEMNDGMPQIPSTSVQSGQQYTISNTRPQREGSVFMGWSYGGAMYDPGDTIQEVRENITLTAVWTKIASFIPVPDNRADPEIPIVIDQTSDSRDSNLSSSAVVVATGCVIALLAILVLTFNSRFKS